MLPSYNSQLYPQFEKAKALSITIGATPQAMNKHRAIAANR